MSRWQQAVPELQFVRALPGEFPDLFFERGQCPGGTRGCFTTDLVFSDTTRQARYWCCTSIRINLDLFSWSPLGRLHGLMHEMGHWAGLHEQYADTISGPGGELCSFLRGPTVMNAGNSNGENCQDPAVDRPTQFDVQQATRYWSGDNPAIPALSETSPGSKVLLLVWDDVGWAETWHGRLVWSWNCGTAQWELRLNDGSYATGIGFHKDSIRRIMSEQFDVVGHGWPDNTYYIAGVSFWNWGFRRWTSRADSNFIPIGSPPC